VVLTFRVPSILYAAPGRFPFIWLRRRRAGRCISTHRSCAVRNVPLGMSTRFAKRRQASPNIFLLEFSASSKKKTPFISPLNFRSFLGVNSFRRDCLRLYSFTRKERYIGSSKYYPFSSVFPQRGGLYMQKSKLRHTLQIARSM